MLTGMRWLDMRAPIPWFALALFVPSFLWAGEGCPVTQAPDPPFRAPSGYGYSGNDGRFLYGTRRLWALVTPHWNLGTTGRKLPYFSDEYRFLSEPHPHMVVFARRLDAEAPAVPAPQVNGAGLPEKNGFMVTRLDIPTSGCWEITARYSPVGHPVETLSYTVMVGN